MIENLTREQSIPRFGKTLSLSRRAASGTLTPGGAGDKLASRGHRRQADRRGEGSAQDRRSDPWVRTRAFLRRRLAL